MESRSPAMKKRGSWSMIAEMVGKLEISDVGHADITESKAQRSHSLPSMQQPIHLSSSLPTKPVRRGSGWSMFSLEDDLDDYDPSTMDLKSQATRQRPRSILTSLTIPTKQVATKKDPLMEFHETRSLAEHELKKQKEAKTRRQQCRDHDEEKSLSSMSSFFEYLTKSDAAGELMDDEASYDGVSYASGSITSFMGLFGEDPEEIAKLSSSKRSSASAAANTNGGKAPDKPACLQSAVKKSKSVKGNRVFIRGQQSAAKGDWKKAVAYYHIALVKQRKYYGEDHIITSNTLNDLGLALVHLGQHFGALTALEEALHIRQKILGAGAEEVAETTSNIWMVLKASEDGY